jgi:Leucine-rich repeat (LRR) protein
VGNLPNGTQCNAILCPPATWNQFGKETRGQACKPCEGSSTFYGQTECGRSGPASREREILDRLFAMTGGRYWNRTHENWLNPGVPICSREGIICSNPDADEMVSEVVLSGFGLRGTIPSEIWELSHARRLRFTDNAVCVSLEGIENAKELTVLQMSKCHMRNLNGLRNASSKIREIHFAWNQFEGSIPEDVFQLRQAGKLYMNNNHFSGRIPTDIGNMANLKELWLWDNKFTGPLPSEIGLLSNLNVLSVKKNALSGAIPSEIQNLELLERLELSQQSGNQFDGSFPAFDKNPKLLILDVSGNSFSGTLPPKLLSKVDPSARIDLNLSNNGFVGRVPEEWEWFELLNIDLSGNQLSELPEVLCNQNGWNNGLVGLLDTCDAILCPPGMHKEGLGMQKEPTDSCQPCEGGAQSAPFFGTRDCLDPKLVAEREILTTFYHLSNGTNWLVQRNWLSTKPVCIWYGIICNEFGFVETIQLEDNFLVGPPQAAAVSKVLRLPDLKTLDLKGNDIVLDLREIQKDTTQLEFLRLSGTGLMSLEGISSAVKLRALHVTNNKIQEIPDELYSMDHLESLFLSFNLIAGPVSPKLGQLTNLKEFYVFGNLLTGMIPSQVGLMSSLRDFVMANNFLSGTIPDQISSLANLEQLSVYNQRGGELFGGPVPSFSGAPNLWYVTSSSMSDEQDAVGSGGLITLFSGSQVL